MDGLLLVDKPAGPTSHDVVARVRRALGEKRIGHTGTLDPAATGLLPLVLGRATRLAQFLAGGEKTYEAVVRFGFATDTADAQGRPVGPTAGDVPTRAAIESALDAFRGTFLQQPPAFSAKKIGGTRSHELARRRRGQTVSDPVEGAPDMAVSATDRGPVACHAPVAVTHRGPMGSYSVDSADFEAPREGGQTPSDPVPGPVPSPVTVTVSRLDLVACVGDCATLTLTCSAGFYVRSLAHDLGERLGVGAHLASLRRTRSGDFDVDAALPLDIVERDPRRAAAAVIPMAEMLPSLPLLRLTADAVTRARNGCELGPQDGVAAPDGTTAASVLATRPALVRLVSQEGGLVGIGRAGTRPGVLHPFVVLM